MKANVSGSKNNMPTPKVHATGVLDILGIALSKQLTERAATPLVGNGNFKSSAAKLVTGTLGYNRAGRIGNALAGGLVIDGAEDFIVALIGANAQRTEGTQSSW